MTAVILAVVTFSHHMTPWLLLALTLAMSLGDAVESPAWRAIFPELVTKEDLTPALALNGIEFNLARAVGPGLAGLVIAVVGVATAFVVDAISFLGVIYVIFKWKRPVQKSTLPAETITEASWAAILICALLARNPNFAAEIGNRNIFLKFFLGASARGCQAV